MESFFSRYRNPMLLGGVLLLQILGLAVQVKRPVDAGRPDTGSVRLIRVWAINGITPFEKLFSAIGSGTRAGWHDYINVIGLRRENEQLQRENQQLRLSEIRMAEEAAQGRRLQALLDFKERFPNKTVAAQIIGSSGTEQSRVVEIDKGAHDGLAPDMAVITAAGVVGKVRDVARNSAQVLLMDDPSSGIGAMLEDSRLYGVAKGSAGGETDLDYVMSDEKVTKGDKIITSGGDGIFPKGLPIGTVKDVFPGSELFWNIRVQPAADLGRLEEVLVITEMAPAPADENQPTRAADILAQRLPTLAPKPSPPAHALQKTSAESPNPKSKSGTTQKQGSAPKPQMEASGAPPSQPSGQTASTEPNKRSAALPQSSTPNHKQPTAQQPPANRTAAGPQ